MNKNFKKLLFSIALLFISNQAIAVKAKIRFLFPVSTKNVTDGFEDSTLKTSEFILAFLMPVSRDTNLDLGYSYFNARIEDPKTITEQYSGVFRAHLLQVGAGYTGFEITRTISLVIDLAVRIPLSGQGEVKGNQNKSEATSISGMGYFISTGAAYGNLEISLFYQNRDLSFDGLTVTRNNEIKDVAIHSTEYGLGFSYTF
tara:strand:- start:851 stop:1453 length:603 start_codon:yes stop_codon:yes gene_type:complete